jgi:putative ABC transport system permease protein
METLRQDLRFGLRTLAKRPGFTLVVALTLALGIGATTAIFSLIYGILLKPFPYRAPERLVRIQSVNTKTTQSQRGGSLPDVEDWRRMNRTLEDLGAYTTFDSDIRGDGPSEAVKMSQLNPQALSILGVTPIIGRMLKPEEDIKGGDVHKALISFRLWQQRFGGDPNIVGRSVQTSINTFNIVGVMPPGFAFPEQTDLWTPMESFYAQTGRPKSRTGRFYPVIARLKSGVTLTQAESDLNIVAAALESQYPKDNEAIRVKLRTMRDAEVGNIRPYLLLLLAAVAFVLLICCANVANLLLARAAARQRESSLRAALGASRGRLVRALLTESLLLSLSGGLLGVGLAYVAVKALLRLIPVELPFWLKVELNAPVLLFSFAVAVATSLIFGTIPALLATRVNLSDALKEGVKGSAASGRLRGALVMAEVALCLLLLVGAGLMMQSFLKLQNLDTGFGTDNLLVLRVTNYRDGKRAERAAALSAFHERALERLRQLPGVSSAGATNSLPYARLDSERGKVNLSVKGRADEELKFATTLAGADISSGYLEALRVPLKRGRMFDARDTTDAPMVLIISERAAQTLFPDRDAIGQQIFWGDGAPGPENPYCTVVGVVGNIKYQAIEASNALELYYPYTQYPVTNVYYVIHTKRDPAQLVAAARQAIHDTDRNAAIVFTKTMEKLIGETLWQRRLWGVMFAAFASLALALAAVGIYGVLSYAVSQRTREIGVRIALGATVGEVLKLVVAQGMRLVVAGVAIGLLTALALTRLMTNMLFGVTATDPLTFAGVALLLALVALIACLIPARRAAKTEPMIALRTE